MSGTAKQRVLEVLENLPAEATLEDAIERFAAGWMRPVALPRRRAIDAMGRPRDGAAQAMSTAASISSSVAASSSTSPASAFSRT
jgi:hypothetical protein